MVVGLQMLVGCITLTIATLLFETPRIDPSWRLAIAFTYTCLVPGLAATVVWFWLVNRIGATRAATFHFLNPFFGVAIAALLLSEQLGPRDILGVLIITLGILAVQISRQSRR
jgi:drug/metabolite transporter (DMT)-like permease